MKFDQRTRNTTNLVFENITKNIVENFSDAFVINGKEHSVQFWEGLGEISYRITLRVAEKEKEEVKNETV
jgi:hypothetical protein